MNAILRQHAELKDNLAVPLSFVVQPLLIAMVEHVTLIGSVIPVQLPRAEIAEQKPA